ncbi:MAG: hypothetical protein WBN48_01880 [Thiogranum sp.]
MRAIRMTITALVLSVSSLALGNAAQAHGYTDKPAYRAHGHHHYHAPRYPSRPRVYGHDDYQYGHHGIYKKHRHYKHYGKAYDWRRRPHKFNDHRSDDSGYRGRHDSGDHRPGRDDYHGNDDHNRHSRDYSRQMRTSYAESNRH